MPRPIILLTACAGALAYALAATAAESARARACATLETQYQQLEARMRAGYSATQAASLWERRRQLQARRWSLRCQDLPPRGR